MARSNTRAATTARRNVNTARNVRGMYVDGNAARRLQEMPARTYYPQQAPVQRPKQRPAGQPKRELSREAQKNREKAMGMSMGFVVFLAVISAAILFFCINYLQLKSDITGSMKNVATLESELTQLREDNDAYYSQVTSDIDLGSIRKTAIGRLGMSYPSDGQTMTYKTAGSSYVRQYQDVPDAK